MAFSKSSTIKYVKAVGSYTESEIAEAMDTLDADELQQLFQVSHSLYKGLKKSKRRKSSEGSQVERKRQQ